MIMMGRMMMVMVMVMVMMGRMMMDRLEFDENDKLVMVL